MPKRTFFRLDEDKRERVIRTAINEFRAKGYEGAKVGEIAKRAEIANGSVYQYFEDKRELFMYCVNWTVENFVREMDRQAPLAGMDFFEYFQSGLPKRVEFWSQEPDLALFSHDLACGNLDFPAGEVNPVRETQRSHIPKLVANGRKWGTLRADVDDETLILFLTGVARETEELIFNRAAETKFIVDAESVKSNAEYLDLVIGLIKNGLAPKTENNTSV